MARGGVRQGAGRPHGKGPHGESTKPIRIPISLITHVMEIIESKGYKLPLYKNSISAGFPSPADDYIEAEIDLNKLLIKHPNATFLVKVSGESMIKAGIHPGDILVVDRSLEPKHGKVVIAAVDGQLTVKRINIVNGKVFLAPENDLYESIELLEGNEVKIWGVVTNVLHNLS